MSTSAWIIDVDYDADPLEPEGTNLNAYGMISGTIPGLLDFLNAGGGSEVPHVRR